MLLKTENLKKFFYWVFIRLHSLQSGYCTTSLYLHNSAFRPTKHMLVLSSFIQVYVNEIAKFPSKMGKGCKYRRHSMNTYLHLQNRFTSIHGEKRHIQATPLTCKWSCLDVYWRKNNRGLHWNLHFDRSTRFPSLNHWFACKFENDYGVFTISYLYGYKHMIDIIVWWQVTFASNLQLHWNDEEGVIWPSAFTWLQIQ